MHSCGILGCKKAGGSIISNKNFINGTKFKENHTNYICNSCMDKFCDFGECSIINCNNKAVNIKIDDISSIYIKDINSGRICENCRYKYKKHFGDCKNCKCYLKGKLSYVFSSNHDGNICKNCYNRYKTVKIGSKHGIFKINFDYVE